METNSISSVNIEDFKDSDFGDPISLLEALSKKRNHSSLLLSDSQSQEAEYFTVSQIARAFNVEEADFLKAIENGEVAADRVVPLFTKDTVEQFLSNRNKGSSILYESFMQEISHMRVNYSYKPVLIMALLNGASSNGEMAISDIVDYFMTYYQERAAAGLIKEKDDSSFVKYPNDRNQAGKTIVRYPITVFVNKGFMTYDRDSAVVKIANPIWSRIDLETKAFIEARCERILEEYFSLI